MRLPLLFISAALLGGCTAFSPTPPPLVNYRCDDGREFSLAVSPSGETATLEIARMRFGIYAEGADGNEEKFSCSGLTLWLQGDAARLDMGGSEQISLCRVKH